MNYMICNCCHTDHDLRNQDIYSESIAKTKLNTIEIKHTSSDKSWSVIGSVQSQM